MKKLLTTICLLVLVSGCGTVAWYRPDTSLDQCYRDSCECSYDANKSFGDHLSLYYQCMELRGYKEWPRKDLPEGTRFRWNDKLMFTLVAGR